MNQPTDDQATPPAVADAAHPASGADADASLLHLVRDALTHLYDPAHLLRHPLNGLLDLGRPNLADPSQPLRNVLLDAVEALEPRSERRGGREGEREARPHQVLTRRYVAGCSGDEVCQQLAISPRQYRREHRKGMQAVAAYVWARRRAGAGEADLFNRGDLEAEVEQLGLRLVPISVTDLLAAAKAAAAALVEGYGLSMSILPGAARLHCLADRTLAKQAILSAVSALGEMATREDGRVGLQLAYTHGQRYAGIALTCQPSLRSANPATVQRALANCEELVSLQHGKLRQRWDGECLHGLDILFQPEQGATVLIVDDNDRMLRLYERYLAGGNYRVTTASSAAEAEAALAEATPNAIVLDIMMRDVDGWEFLQRLRSRADLREVPAIVCSVLNEPRLAQFLGAQAYLKKPVVAEDLLAALERVLDAYSPPGKPAAAP